MMEEEVSEMNREQIKKRVIILIQSILGDEEMVIKEEYGLTNDLDLSSLEIILLMCGQVKNILNLTG